MSRKKSIAVLAVVLPLLTLIVLLDPIGTKHGSDLERLVTLDVSQPILSESIDSKPTFHHSAAINTSQESSSVTTSGNSNRRPSGITVPELLRKRGIPDGHYFLRARSEWLEAARRGDPNAAIGLFLAMENCLSSYGALVKAPANRATSSSTDCSNLDRSLAGEKWQLLKVAADNGDTLAQFLYGSRAWALFARERASGQVSSVVYNTDSLAVSYLENSAASGITEAYAPLLAYYLDTVGGRYNLARAYAFAVLVKERDASTLNLRVMGDIERRLRPGELKEAEIILASLRGR